MKKIIVSFLLFLALVGSAQPSHERLQFKLDSLRTIGNFAGLSISIIDRDNKIKSFVSGFSDVEKQISLSTKQFRRK